MRAGAVRRDVRSHRAPGKPASAASGRDPWDRPEPVRRHPGAAHRGASRCPLRSPLPGPDGPGGEPIRDGRRRRCRERDRRGRAHGRRAEPARSGSSPTAFIPYLTSLGVPVGPDRPRPQLEPSSPRLSCPCRRRAPGSAGRTGEQVVLHAGNIGLKQGLEQVVDAARHGRRPGRPRPVRPVRRRQPGRGDPGRGQRSRQRGLPRRAAGRDPRQPAGRRGCPAAVGASHPDRHEPAEQADLVLRRRPADRRGHPARRRVRPRGRAVRGRPRRPGRRTGAAAGRPGPAPRRTRARPPNSAPPARRTRMRSTSRGRLPRPAPPRSSIRSPHDARNRRTAGRP